MPNPTKEQFDAAAKKVTASAPAGLSRDQLLELINKELSGYQTDEGTRGAITRSIARASGGIVPTQAIKDENGNDLNATGGRLNGFLSSTVRNPGVTGAAHPTGLGDMAPLLLPSAFSGTGEVSVPSLLRGMRRVVSAGARDAANGSAVGSPLRFARGAAREVMTPAPSVSRNFSDLPLYKQMENLPDISPAPSPRGGGPVVSPRVPNEFAMPGQIVGKAPKLEDELTRIIDAIRAEGGGEPSLMSSHPSVVETAGEGALKQSGKFGKSGSLGQPGGYSSGRPPISEGEMDKILNKLGGRGERVGGGVSSPPPAEPPPAAEVASPTSDLDFHSGAEPGSAEAKSAQSLHRDLGTMEADYKRKMSDPLAALLTSLFAEESMRHVMSSHGSGK
jgi:hypothetical protein